MKKSKCKDCKWFETFYHGFGSKWGTFSSFCMFKCKNINSSDPFCYDGKRKEENNERKAV